MNRKIALASVAAAATIAGVTAAAVPDMAAAGTQTVTQHFTAKSSSSPLKLSKTAYALTDNDVRNGKTIGRDVLYCTNAPGASNCHVAFAQNGGLLYARFTLTDKTGALKGVVTGGTGSFAKAKGTLTGQAVSRTAVKITLHYTK